MFILFDFCVILRSGEVLSGYKAAFPFSSHTLVFQALEANHHES